MIKQENFRAIFQASPTPHLILKPDAPRFTIAGVNDAYLKATGTVKEDLLNRGLFEAFPENPADPGNIGLTNLRDSLEKVLETKASDHLEVNRYDIPVSGENRFEVHYWSPQNIPVLGGNGCVEYIIHTAPDITAEVLAEHNAANALYELHQQKQHYRSLFDHNPDAVYSFDRNGRFMSVNHAAAVLLETTIEELKNNSFVPFIAGKDVDRVFTHFLRAAEGEVQRYECEVITAKRNKRVIKVSNMPIVVGGEIVGVYGIAKNITEQRRKSEEEALRLKQKEEELKASLKEKEVLLAEVHHRVKNNLAMISGLMQLQAFEENDESLKTKLMNGVRRIKAIAVIHEQLYLCEDLTELDLAKNLKTLASDILDTFDSCSNIQLETDLEAICLNINQAIPVSLIANEVLTCACEALGDEDGGQNRKIQLKLDRNKETVRLTISRQCTLSNSETSGEGAMGLLLIKNLADQLEAKYNYYTDEGEARFTLQFEKADVKGIGNANL